MAKAKKPKFEWFYRSGAGPLVCENGESVLSIYTYGQRPLLVVNIKIAYLNMPTEEIWENGRKIGTMGSGWRYSICAYCGGGITMLHITGTDSHNGILARSPTYTTRQDVIKAALNQFIEACDKLLLIPGDSSKPYWGWSQQQYFSRPGNEKLSYYLCMPEMEPLWKLLDEVTAHDNWLAEVRAPRKNVFTEQLNLFNRYETVS